MGRDVEARRQHLACIVLGVAKASTRHAILFFDEATNAMFYPLAVTRHPAEMQPRPALVCPCVRSNAAMIRLPTVESFDTVEMAVDVDKQ